MPNPALIFGFTSLLCLVWGGFVIKRGGMPKSVIKKEKFGSRCVERLKFCFTKQLKKLGKGVQKKKRKIIDI